MLFAPEKYSITSSSTATVQVPVTQPNYPPPSTIHGFSPAAYLGIWLSQIAASPVTPPANDGDLRALHKITCAGIVLSPWPQDIYDKLQAPVYAHNRLSHPT